MYLKEIQTYGFKSFADKINFEFTNNINGIVGPNGSGKSNVVDAVRWVLGEQSNKSLRATDSTSVIFSGSKSRKPLNSAMVNIIFDNTDRQLPIDFSEVSIKRILYRTGENEYYLNNEKCRLKDITELLTDSGAAKESFNIIGQGKIDEILTTKPLERRIIFEEAAGVLKYKRRKEEAIRKLERTNNNINRINDIISELSNNLEPLEKQSNDAKKYLEYKDKLTNYDISLMIYDVNRYSEEFKNSKEKIANLNDEITKLNMNNTTYDISILQGKDKLSNIEKTITEYNNEILSLTKELEQKDADIRLFRERKKYLSVNSDIAKIDNIKETILNKKNVLLNTESSLEITNKEIDNYNNSLTSINESYTKVNNQINQLNKKIDETNRDITNINYKINYLEDSITSGGNLPQSIKGLLKNPLFSGIHNTIGNLITVDSEYSLAVSTSLAGASNYLVVDDRNLASKLVNYLKENKLGRATFFPLDVIKGRYIDPETMKKLELTEGYISTLDKVVKYNEKYKNIILNQLGNVILSDNIYSANKISNIISNKYKIVTLDGQLVNVGGSITGGDKIKSNDIIKQKYELTELKNKQVKLINTNNSYKEELTTLQKELAQSNDKIHNINIDKSTCINTKNNYLDTINNLKKEIKDLELELSNIESITNNSTESEESNLINSYYQIKENELKVSKLEVKIDTILNNLNEDYSITYNEAKEKYIIEDNPEDIRKEVLNLKNSLKDFQMVNLGAIDEYLRVSERYNFLTKQKEDLNKAEATLLEIINDMDSIMEEKFNKTFQEIKQEFQKVFRELFKGGSANLYMTDPNNILETGIELEATPPGKNLKTVQSLSGGEKTFTAIALLFAILNVRPVPFCLFDEVEAALDEANVDAFGEYLNKYRNKTQFIIITHKKKTMEFIDTLYGITMQESGVSKKVSVKLNDLTKDNK